MDYYITSEYKWKDSRRVTIIIIKSWFHGQIALNRKKMDINFIYVKHKLERERSSNQQIRT